MLNLLALTFLAVLAVGYFALASRDVGLGMLLPWTAHGPGDRRRAFAALSPYFLGTEVWLVALVAVVGGLFPQFKDAVIPWAGPVLLVLAAGWIVRDAGLWFWTWGRARAWLGAWSAAVVVGSWTLALSWGVLLGGILTGGHLLSLPTLATTLTVTTLFALSGAAFGAERLVAPDSEAGHSAAADTAARATRWLARLGLGLALATVAIAVVGGAVTRDPLAAALAVVPALLALSITTGLSGPRFSPHTSAVAIVGWVLAVLFGGELPGLSSDPATVGLVAWTVGPALPVMILGQVWLYRMLRRPATPRPVAVR